MTRASDTAKLLGAGATILDGTTISTADNDPQLILKCTDTDASTGPKLDLERNPGEAGADGDNLAQINFYGYNDASEKTQYLYLFAEAADVANGSEDVRFGFGGLVAGADSSLMTFMHGTSATGADPEMVFNDSSKDINFRVESNGQANMLFVDGGNDTVSFQPNSGTLTIKAGSDDATNNVRLEGGGTTSTYLEYRGYLGHKFFNDTTQKMMIDDALNGVFIGKTSTSASVAGMQIRTGIANGNNIVQDSTTVLRINRQSDDGTLVDLMHANNTEGTISISGGTVSYNAFSGSHWSRLSDNSKPTILVGTVIETIDEMCDWYQAEFIMEEATEDTPEITEKVSIALPDGKSVGDTMSITHEGITYDNATILKENDKKHTKCKISDTADSTRVYGVYTAWDNDDDAVNDMYVTAVGTSVVRINKGVTVSAGDLLSSNGDGTAKVQDDDIIRSKTIGKVLTNIKQETYSDGSYTVPCALYCG